MENNVRTQYISKTNHFNTSSDEQKVIPLVCNGETIYTEEKPVLPSFLISDEDPRTAIEEDTYKSDIAACEGTIVNDTPEDLISVHCNAIPVASISVNDFAVETIQAEAAPVISSPSVNSIFAQRHISVISKNKKTISKGVGELARFIAEHYNDCSDFYRAVRSSFTREGHRGEYVKPDSMRNDKWNSITAVSDHLYEYGIFSYHNRKDSKIAFTTAEAPNVQNFFNGDYLELYAASVAQQAVSKIASEFGIDDYEIISNIVIENRDGTTNELDLVIRIGDKLF